MAQKTALSVQSLSCHGKSSLTEALPIISAEGISLSVLPTVLLSTHTGGFGTPARCETDNFLKDSLEHFKEENIRFDGIYTGYFSKTSQIDLIKNSLKELIREKTFVLVDPVLGDNGKLFNGITEDFTEKMIDLCKEADVITPNVTEAFLLTTENYCEDYTEYDIISLSFKLYEKTKAKIIITGIEIENKIGVCVFDGENTRFIYSKKLPDAFHGTGDIFASLIFSSVLKGMALNKAVKRASVFIAKAIKKTVATEYEERNGLSFEELLKNSL